MRRALLSGSAVIALLAAFGGCPSPGANTPEDAFQQILDRVREGKYDRVWGLLSERYQRDLQEGFEKLQESLKDETVNRLSSEGMIRTQTGLPPEAFLTLSPRKIYERILERRRDGILGMTAVGEAVVDGDVATLSIRAGEDMPAFPMTFKRVKGRWLIDADPTGDVRAIPR